MLKKLKLNNMKWRISPKLILPFQIDDLRSIIGMSKREVIYYIYVFCFVILVNAIKLSKCKKHYTIRGEWR
jgi:hypothetical protein